MDFLTFFLFGSVAVGLLILTESLILKRTSGKFQNNPFLAGASFLELIWLSLSIYTLFALELNIAQSIIPALYVLHYIFGWFYNIKQLKKAGVIDKIKAGQDDDIALPKKSVDYSLSFAIVYVLVSLAVLTNHYKAYLPNELV